MNKLMVDDPTRRERVKLGVAERKGERAVKIVVEFPDGSGLEIPMQPAIAIEFAGAVVRCAAHVAGFSGPSEH